MAVDAGISWTKIAIRAVGRHRIGAAFDSRTGPGSLIAVRGDDHPFFAQGMPTLFPSWARRSGVLR